MITPRFPGGKDKCLTLSYDDGVSQDKRLVTLFNEYGIKGTFNLNSGCFGKCCPANGFTKPVTHNKIEAGEVAELYKGHEAAVHTLTHPHLEFLSAKTIAYEILQDKENLEKLVGYPVTGMAFPFGTYNEMVLEEMKKAGIRYGRTVQSTRTFGMPQDFLRWHPTCHFGEDCMEMLIKRFLHSPKENCALGRLKVFYVWGHSYELDGNDTWDLMQDFCKRMSRQPDVWYATNMEIVEYHDAVERLVFSRDGKMVKNPSVLAVWLHVGEETVCVEGGETIHLL